MSLKNLLKIGERKHAQALWTFAGTIHDRTREPVTGDLAVLYGNLRESGPGPGQIGDDDWILQVLVVAAEAARRATGLDPYRTQLCAAVALHTGAIIEMRTGEGKTLAVILAAALEAAHGQGCHIITTNDYLASRDAELAGRVLSQLGLTVGVVTEDSDPPARRDAYSCDITYATNKEVGFDLLRDEMASVAEHRVQRELVSVIVDEADSVLIDEARTPLIISGPGEPVEGLHEKVAAIVQDLEEDVHFKKDLTTKRAWLTEAGIDQIEEALDVNLFDPENLDVAAAVQAAVTVKAVLVKGRDYTVNGDEVLIVDDFTGRTLVGRRWHDGIHQAVEAAEGVPVRPETQTLATITLQNLFRSYEKLAGCTGTALTDAAELTSVYGTPVIPIPTHRPVIRVDEPDRIYRTKEAKLSAAINEIVTRQMTGQPVLVGTTSINNSELIAQLLADAGVECNVLNARRHTQEAAVIAQAGRSGQVTVATNMAGRGVDILLGGNADLLAEQEITSLGLDPDSDAAEALRKQWERDCANDAEKVRAAGGLAVVGTERHEARRIDDQLRGRAGRQGDPGWSCFFLSLEDELIERFSTGAMNKVMGLLPDHMPLTSKTVTRSVEKAQLQVEAANAAERAELLKYDDVYATQRRQWMAIRDELIVGDPHVVIDRFVELLPEPDDGTYDGTDMEGVVAKHAACTHPFVDGVRQEIGARSRALGDLWVPVSRQVPLQIMDKVWRGHLQMLDHLRDAVGLRGTTGTSLPVLFTLEASKLFEDTITNAAVDVCAALSWVRVLDAGAGTTIVETAPET